MSKKVTGRELARLWGLEVQQALYRRTGDWYHHLKRFPAALLDERGYLFFESPEAFEACSELRVGKHPERHGGWVYAPDGISAILGYVQVVPGSADSGDAVIESLLRPRKGSRGQGWMASSACRKAIETYAMDWAIRHLSRTWPEVQDVSASNPFDLLCRDGEREIHVEVKGTSLDGNSFLLTRNEVRHAFEQRGRVALFLVFGVEVNRDNHRCSGGTARFFEPWDIRQCELEPIAYECKPPGV